MVLMEHLLHRLQEDQDVEMVLEEEVKEIGTIMDSFVSLLEKLQLQVKMVRLCVFSVGLVAVGDIPIEMEIVLMKKVLV